MANKKNRVGEKYQSINSGEVTIIDYHSWDNVDVQFQDGTILKGNYYGNIKKGRIESPNLKTVCNVGFIGVGKYRPKSDKKRYDCWSDMLKRAYSSTKQEKQPTYKNATVIKEWHNFQNFAQWYEENYVNGWQLDKDLLVKNNKEYSPEKCCFLPRKLNLVLLNRKNDRGTNLIGVVIQNDKFSSKLSINGKQKFLGYFETELKAFEAYKEAKEDYLKSLAEKYKNQLPSKVYKAIINYKINKND